MQLGNIDVNYQTVANINYGSMASWIGMPSWTAELGAGAYQIISHYPRFKGNVGTITTYFDDPADNYWIKFGYWFEEQHKVQFGSIDAEMFTSALDEYIIQNGEPPDPLSPGYIGK